MNCLRVPLIKTHTHKHNYMLKVLTKIEQSKAHKAICLDSYKNCRYYNCLTKIISTLYQCGRISNKAPMFHKFLRYLKLVQHSIQLRFMWKREEQRLVTVEIS